MTAPLAAVLERAAALWAEHRATNPPPPYGTGRPTAAAERADDAAFARCFDEIARLLPGEGAEYHAAVFDLLFERVDPDAAVAA